MPVREGHWVVMGIAYPFSIFYNNLRVYTEEAKCMSGNNVQITSKCIKNSLKKYTSLKSICEYVWNGFDAKATQVVVEASENILYFLHCIFNL